MCDLNGIKERVRKLKSNMGITTETLAEKSGISVGTLNKFFGNETKEPSIKTVIKLSKVFDVSADYIIYGDKDKDFFMSDSEKALIQAYRNHPEMQPAIKKMLDIDSEQQKISDDIASDLKNMAIHTKDG